VSNDNGGGLGAGRPWSADTRGADSFKRWHEGRSRRRAVQRLVRDRGRRPERRGQVARGPPFIGRGGVLQINEPATI